MKNQIKILALSSLTLATLLFGLGARANGKYIPENHCHQIAGSKRYLDMDFSENYPRSVTFECTYECNVKGRLEKVAAVTDVTVRNMQEDAKLTVCQGVKVKKVPWGYDYDGSNSFYAFSTRMKDMKRFAFENIDQNNETETLYLKKLKEDIVRVAATYSMLSTPYFRDASKTLMEIAKGLPEETSLLDQYIEQIVGLKGEIKLLPTAESLVLSNINSAAAWRIPTHTF